MGSHLEAASPMATLSCLCLAKVELTLMVSAITTAT